MKPGNRHGTYRLQFLKKKMYVWFTTLLVFAKKEVSTFSNDLEWYQTDGDRMHVREAPFWTVLVLYLGKKSAPKHPGKPFYPLGKHGKKVLQTILAGLYAPPPFGQCSIAHMETTHFKRELPLIWNWKGLPPLFAIESTLFHGNIKIWCPWAYLDVWLLFQKEAPWNNS